MEKQEEYGNSRNYFSRLKLQQQELTDAATRTDVPALLSRYKKANKRMMEGESRMETKFKPKRCFVKGERRLTSGKASV